MGVKLHVRVQEARNLAAKDSNGLSDPYVRLQLGASKAKSKIIYKNLNPVWNEEFFFNVEDPFSEQLHITVWDSDFGLSDDFLGQLTLALSDVYGAENRTVDTWHVLEHRKAKEVVSGEIRLTLSLIGKFERTSSGSSAGAGSSSFSRRPSLSPSSDHHSDSKSFSGGADHATPLLSPTAPKRGLFSRRFSRAESNRSGHLNRTESTSSTGSSVLEFDGELAPESFWEDDGKPFEAPAEMPPPLAGGVVADRVYKVTCKELHGILFANGSEFQTKLFHACHWTRGNTEPWHEGEGGFTRRVTYLTAPSTLIKGVKATEVQSYSNSGQGGYVVDVTKSTPDAPYGGTFRTRVQVCVFPGLEDPLGTARVRVSYEPEFLQTTSLRGVIEKGMAQGMKETYQLFLDTLDFFAPPVTPPNALQKAVHSSRLKQFQERFYVFAAVASSFFLLLFCIHIALVGRNRTPRGLEPYLLGLDLPDSVRELVLTWLVVALAHIVLVKVEVQARARLLKFGDHGIRAQGEGWLLTVALIEGVNLPKADVTGFSDPYVVFTCNGMSRTSSVKLQTLNPEWNDILEFDAMEDPPTLMTLEVFDYDGPFSEAELLGRAEINFLKRSGGELADLWIELEGRRAKAANSRLHMRVVLTNTANDSGDSESYVSSKLLEKVKSETGRALTHSDNKRNEAFQRLFQLPEHETLINDYVCAVKKKFNLQGRVFLSPRQLAFYSNIFGHKTQFSIAWEDVDEIRENSTSVSKFTRLLNPYVTLYARKGRALDAKPGSYGVDNKGRLKFRFQSFVKPGPAMRTIQVLWKNRACSPELCAAKVAEATKDLRSDDTASTDGSEDGPFLALEEPEMTLASEIDVPIGKAALCRMFEEDRLDERVAAARGLVNYEHTPWEQIEDRTPPTFRREVSYAYPRRVCPFGSRVTSLCQLTKVSEEHTIIEEISTLHDVPFGNLFQVQTKKVVKEIAPNKTHVQALVGVSFHRKTRFQSRIRSSVLQHNVRDLTETANIIVTEVIKSVQCGEGPIVAGRQQGPAKRT